MIARPGTEVSLVERHLSQRLSYSWLGAHFVRNDLEPARTSCESAPALFLPVKPSASWSAIDHNLGSKTGNLIWIKNLEVAKSGFLLPVRRGRPPDVLPLQPPMADINRIKTAAVRRRRLG
jgi:hypothetical protein